MRLGSKQILLGVLATLLLCLVTIPPASTQTTTPAKKPATGQATPARRPAAAPPAANPNGPLMADQVYKNIRVLHGLTEDQFMNTMGLIAASLGANCILCHDDGISTDKDDRWAAFALDTKPLKVTARKMIVMVNAINKNNFAGQQAVTCFTCHRGDEDPPEVIPQIAMQYAPPAENEEPDAFRRQDPKAPTPDQVLDRYIEAIGGAARVGAMKSFIAKGTYSGYDTDFQAIPMDIYAKAPDESATVLHTAFGLRSAIFNGTAGWNATPDATEPLPILPMTMGNLASSKVMAQIAFPAEIKDAATNWIVNAETTSGGDPQASQTNGLPDRDVYVLQGLNSRRLPVKLYFDQKTGLLVRIVTVIDTALGIIPSQIDYAQDSYRDVNGIKVPFKWIETWTDGQSNFELTGVQINAPVDDAQFAKPNPPTRLQPESRSEKQ